jgi:hypothetical protein
MLQINLVIEDEKISLDELQEEIADFEDYVQSSDVAAMQSTYSYMLKVGTDTNLPHCRIVNAISHQSWVSVLV